ncbi:MAG TPA: MFS transporter [Thermoguttaceae bacterium]|nr:MFS transporter [Thermoguttaceae bacterium]
MRRNPLISPGYRWEMIALLWGAFFLNQGDRQVFGSVLPLVRDALGLSDVQLGLVVTVFTVFYGILVPVAGYAGDAFQKRWVVAISLLTFSVGTLLTGGATGLVMLLVFRSIATGAGEAFYYPAANSLIGQYHCRNRATAMAIHQTANYTGIVLGGWLAALIGQTYGWRASFFTFGVAGIVWCGLVLLRFRNDRADASAETDAAAKVSQRPPLGEVLRNTLSKPTLYLLSLAFGGMVFVHVGFVTWMPTFLYEKFHLTLAGASLSSMLWHHAAAYVGVLIGARVADRLVPRRKQARLEVEFVGLLLGAPFICLMGGANTLWLACFGLAGFGFFRGVYDSNLFAALFDVIEPKYRASATGIMLSIAFVIGSLSPLLLGWIKPAVGLSAGIASLGAVYVMSALVVLAAKKRFFEKDYCGTDLA